MSEVKKKRILIYLRNHMQLGGVETYMYKQAKNLKQCGWQIVWVRKGPKAKFDPSLADVFADGLTIIWDRDIQQKELETMVSGCDAEIKIVTFNIGDFAKAEQFRNQFKCCPVHTFYFISHYMGDALFVEDGYAGKAKERVRKRVMPIMQKSHQNNHIRCFNIKHVQRITTSYEYCVNEPNAYYVPAYDFESVFDEERCRTLANRERFNLLTVTRFDFPHKGYLMGLIEAYAQLIEKYPRLEMTIVGYGRDFDKVKAKIATLSPKARNGIWLAGKVSPERLVEYYNDANLNISVAGCCSQGAKNGTLSIPAKHYDYTCEVYGYLPKSKPFLISEEPGEPVLPYIEQVLNMSEDTYCDRCRDAFNTYNDSSASLRSTMDELENLSGETLNPQDIAYLLKQETYRKLRNIPKGVFRRMKRLLTKAN